MVPERTKCTECSKVLRRDCLTDVCKACRSRAVPGSWRTCMYCTRRIRKDNTTEVCQRHQYIHYNERAQARQRARGDERRDFTDSFKLERGCTDCGYNENACALDFDHLPEFTKDCDVSYARYSSMERLLKEIAKCEVVCANCHRVRTMKRAKKNV